ncbi:MAG: Choice-of-anchor protein [Ignavibacteria bacterium]|nr:Choice-of-anchor protein [Ignavibacteria bacterium]
MRFSFFSLDADGKNYRDTIKGVGGGKPHIKVNPNPCNIQTHINCASPTKDTTITIENDGADFMMITDLKFQTGTDFDFKNGKPIDLPKKLLPGDTYPVTITFKAATPGIKTDKLCVVSNSENSTAGEFCIDITGERDNIDFTAAPDIDFTIICPDSLTEKTITLTNTGSIPFNITATATAPYTLPVSSWTIAPGTPQTVTVRIQTKIEGTYNSKVTFKDAICNTIKEVNTICKVILPKIDGGPIGLDALTGTQKETTINIVNNTGRDLTITSATPDFPEFTIVPPTKSLPWAINAGASQPITIRYKPVTERTLDGWLVVKGEPCSFIDSIKIIGTSKLAEAVVMFGKYSAYVGEQIDIPMQVILKKNFATSGVTGIKTTITFDSSLLRLDAPSPNSSISNGILQTVSYDNLVSDRTDNNESVSILKFTVLDSKNPCSDLVPKNSLPIGGVVMLRDSVGQFCKKDAQASFSTKDYEVNSGDIFDIGIYMDASQGVADFHTGFSTQLKFNATLIEPLDAAIKDSVFDEAGMKMRIVQYNDLPVTAGSERLVKSHRFRAMLGDADSSYIIIQNSQSLKGKVVFTSEKQGTFKLKNICKSETGNRYFLPYGKTQILSINPNPSGGSAIIEYEIGENGNVKLNMFDILGMQNMEFINTEMKPGTYKASIESNKFSNGSYVIILQTTTQTISKRLDIIK